MKKGADWAKICHEYVTTDATIRDLSAKYNLSVKSIGVRASAEKWAEKRVDFRAKLTQKVITKGNGKKEMQAKVADTAVKKTIEKEANAIVKWQDKVNKACDNAIQALLEQSDEAQTLPPVQLQAWLKALDTAMRIRRELAGYISPADLAKIEIAKEDLKIRQEEHERNMALNAESKEPITITIDDEMEKYAK